MSCPVFVENSPQGQMRFITPTFSLTSVLLWQLTDAASPPAARCLSRALFSSVFFFYELVSSPSILLIIL